MLLKVLGPFLVCMIFIAIFKIQKSHTQSLSTTHGNPKVVEIEGHIHL
jgi:hypothetical protein